MAINFRNLDIDPLGAAIPGQSLTSKLGEAPYERPPRITKPEDALEALLKGLDEDVQRENISRIITAGISVETIASAMVMKAFADGMFNPDVAELIKPFLCIAIIAIANEEGVERINVLNEVPTMPISLKDVTQLVSSVGIEDATENMAPNFSKLLEGNMNEIDQEEQIPEDNEMIPESTGSFLDMPSDVPEEPMNMSEEI